MYANRELLESQGTFIEINFGDGDIKTNTKEATKVTISASRAPDAEQRRHYFIVNIHDKERNLRKEFIKATYEEEELPPKQQALFDIIREIGRTVQGKTTIEDIITG
jgi:hypothetical protein